MTIAKKLYLGFSGMILLALILFSVSQFGLWREQAAKRKTNRSFQVLRNTSSLQYLLGENQIHGPQHVDCPERNVAQITDWRADDIE